MLREKEKIRGDGLVSVASENAMPVKKRALKLRRRTTASTGYVVTCLLMSCFYLNETTISTYDVLSAFNYISCCH